MVKLVFLPANQAYAFVFGDGLLRLDGEDMFYKTRAKAVAAAKRRGLTVAKNGRVS